MPHDHGHIGAQAGDRRVGAAIAANLALTAAQIAGGIVSGSLALIADAVHNLSDALSLIIALAARRIARRPADAAMTFGYGRAEPVAALINLTTLIVIGVWLGWEALWRLADPQPVAGWIVVGVAGLALAVDAATALLTYRMARGSMNIRAAFLHNLADAMGSVAVIVGGTLILLYDWRLVDPAITLGISGYILWHAGRDIVPVIRLLMLGTPPSLDPREVLSAMRATGGVDDVHHLHLWEIDETRPALSAHVVASGQTGAPLTALRAMLRRRFGIEHCVLEAEPASGQAVCDDAAPIGCGPAGEAEAAG